MASQPSRSTRHASGMESSPHRPQGNASPSACPFLTPLAGDILQDALRNDDGGEANVKQQRPSHAAAAEASAPESGEYLISIGEPGTPVEDPASRKVEGVPESSTGLKDQFFNNSRPLLSSCPMLSRRELRKLDKSWTLDEVKQHSYRDDGWIAVEGNVYDITQHIVDHDGWKDGGNMSTVLSILAHLG
eukprot:gene30520-35548_t